MEVLLNLKRVWRYLILAFDQQRQYSMIAILFALQLPRWAGLLVSAVRLCSRGPSQTKHEAEQDIRDSW